MLPQKGNTPAESRRNLLEAASLHLEGSFEDGLPYLRPVPPAEDPRNSLPAESWEVLAQETIGVFVRAAFPGRIRMSKIILGLQRCCDLLMVSKFLPVIIGKAVNSLGHRLQSGDGGLLDQFGLAAFDRAQHCIFGLLYRTKFV